jgi:hypothetical protein
VQFDLPDPFGCRKTQPKASVSLKVCLTRRAVGFSKKKNSPPKNNTTLALQTVVLIHSKKENMRGWRGEDHFVLRHLRVPSVGL